MDDLLSVIFVTYNTGDIVLEAIESIANHDDTLPIEIILVDNHSSDDAVELVKQRYPEVDVHVLDSNRGFGVANNYGVAQASGNFVAILNPDLTVQPDSLKKLVDFLKENPSAGVVGPRTLDASGNIALTARCPYTVTHIALVYLNFATLLPAWVKRYERQVNFHATQPQNVPWLQGSCLVMSRQFYEQIGGFDEDIFLYIEDTDICKKVHDAGRQVIYYPDAHVTHVGGTSTHDFHEIRVRAYHVSPQYYFRKYKQPHKVWALKVIFAIELVSKSMWRRIFNIFRPDARRAAQAQVELKIMWESWKY